MGTLKDDAPGDKTTAEVESAGASWLCALVDQVEGTIAQMSDEQLNQAAEEMWEYVISLDANPCHWRAFKAHDLLRMFITNALSSRRIDRLPRRGEAT